MWENWVQSLDWEDPLEKGKATHFSILVWRIPWTVHGVTNSWTQLSDFHFCYIWSFGGIDCISPLYLVVLLEFYLVPLFGTYSSCISFCLTSCDYDFHSAGCKVVVLASAVCHLVDEAKKLVQASWLEELVPAHWWVELGFVLLVGRAISRGMSRGLWAQ